MSRNRRALQVDGALLEYTDNEVVQSTRHATGTDEILEWCITNEVDADVLWGGYDGTSTHSEWGIKDDKQRMLFALRWT